MASVTARATQDDTYAPAELPEVPHRADFPEVFGFKEVSECLGVKGSNLQFIRDLPEEVAEIQAGRIWLAREIRAFAKVYNERRPHAKD